VAKPTQEYSDADFMSRFLYDSVLARAKARASSQGIDIAILQNRDRPDVYIEESMIALDEPSIMAVCEHVETVKPNGEVVKVN
jgi:hypothetical protein